MIINRIKQMIKQAVVSTLLSDDSPYPRSFANYSGKDTYYTRLSPYGLDTHPPRGAHVLLFSAQAQEANKFGIASDPINRFKPLAENEVVLYNTATQDYVYLKANGDIEIDSKADVTVNAVGDVNVTAGGDITAEAGAALTAKGATTATIEAPTITLTGNVTINGTLSQTGGGLASMSGNLNVTGTIVAPEATIGGIDVDDHVHGGVTTGGATTGGPQ